MVISWGGLGVGGGCDKDFDGELPIIRCGLLRHAFCRAALMRICKDSNCRFFSNFRSSVVFIEPEDTIGRWMNAASIRMEGRDGSSIPDAGVKRTSYRFMDSLRTMIALWYTPLRRTRTLAPGGYSESDSSRGAIVADGSTAGQIEDCASLRGGDKRVLL